MAQDQLQQSLALARAESDLASMGDSLQQLAQFANTAGEFHKAQKWATESLALCRQVERKDWSAYALSYLGKAAFCLGDYTAATNYYDESYHLFKSLSHQRGLSSTLGGLGLMAWHQGDEQLGQASDYFKQGLAIARRLGSQMHITGLLAGLTQVESDLGHASQAYEHGLEGLQIAEEVGSRIFITQNLCALASVATLRQAYADAKRYLRRALQLATDHDLLPWVMAGLYRFTVILYQESEVSHSTCPDVYVTHRRIRQLLTYVGEHRTSWHTYRERAGRLHQQLIARMPTSEEIKSASTLTEYSLRDIVERTIR
ncbi:tetratricopeptide repeat protein [Chloroflexi bacterium TSY]|nr:tetratricopeptide repeat protein [Chloroflexi bacterium TSY]